MPWGSRLLIARDLVTAWKGLLHLDAGPGRKEGVFSVSEGGSLSTDAQQTLRNTNLFLCHLLGKVCTWDKIYYSTLSEHSGHHLHQVSCDNLWETFKVQPLGCGCFLMEVGEITSLEIPATPSCTPHCHLSDSAPTECSLMASESVKEVVCGGLTEAMGSHRSQWDETFLWCGCFGITRVSLRNPTRLCKDPWQNHWFSKLDFGELYLVFPHLFVSP